MPDRIIIICRNGDRPETTIDHILAVCAAARMVIDVLGGDVVEVRSSAGRSSVPR